MISIPSSLSPLQNATRIQNNFTAASRVFRCRKIILRLLEKKNFKMSSQKRGILRCQSLFQFDSPHSIYHFMEEGQLHQALKDVCNAVKQCQFKDRLFLWARSRILRLPLKPHLPGCTEFCLNAVQPNFTIRQGRKELING